jgi:hypothetical protein
MALSSIWITVASIIATFNIAKAVDEHGKVIEPSYEYLSGLIRSVLTILTSLVANFINNYCFFVQHATSVPMLFNTAIAGGSCADQGGGQG